jgi:hypothetical protein
MDNYIKKTKQLLKEGKEILDMGNYGKLGSRNYRLDDLNDGSELLRKFLLETKNRKDVHDQNEIKKLLKKLFTTNHYKINKTHWEKLIPIDDIIFGFGGHDYCCILFSNKEFCVSTGNFLKKSYIFSLDDLKFLNFQEKTGWQGQDKIFLSNNELGESSVNSSKKLNNIVDELKTLFNERWDKIKEEKERKKKEKEEELRLKKEKEKKLKEDEDRIKKEKWLKKEEELRIKEIKRKEVLEKDILDVSKEFDSDKDGIIDFNQGKDDFMNLLKKHQGSIIEIDQNHITKFIQVSNYLKTKRENIQKQFEKIKTSKNTNQMKEYTGVLKNQIDTFNLLSYNSMIMIISLVEKDLLTFNEIYLTFDKLNIFNSNWENELSNKLENIGSKLDDLIFSINKMGMSIVNEILKMSIMNQIQMNRLNKSVNEGNMMINDSLSSLNSSLSSNLKSINSSIDVNNLLTGINTYQLYNLNKNTKSLRS